MGLVKTVARKLFNQVEDLHRQGRINAFVFRPFLKNGALLGHFLRFFLTHGTPQQVSTTQRVAGKFLRDLHDLLLVENNPVGGLKNGLQPLVLILRVGIRNLLSPVLTINKILNHPGLKWTRSEQGDQGDDIFKAIRPQILDQLLHTAAFELEYGGCLSALK